MTHKTLNRIIGALAFLVPMVMYAFTIAPTVVFWDVGEFIAAAYMMQVPHPPGAPLFLILTRVGMMFPIAEDLAVRAHLLSACLSALAIMFAYLFMVRVIIKIRGSAETLADKITTYGTSFIGAMTLAFTTTYWDNSIEAEVYGASMFFLTTILWLVMRWLERANNEGNEKYILLIAYLIGLSLGVHLLALLAIFPVLMIIYFQRYEYSLNSFIKFGAVAVAVFFVVYPGIVKWMPGMMDGEFQGQRSAVWEFLPWLLLGGSMYGIYYSYVHKKKTLHIALLSGVMIFFGYTTYTSVIIRANENPPMNENDPSNLARLTSYLGREQYGDAPFVKRRYSQEPQHQGIYTNYTSDMDFLIRYQLNHMFFRYMGWNFVGSAGDYQDAGVAAKDTFAIPLLIGLFGFYYHFRRDWKMGLTLLAAFIILGPILALYQNQQEPQPRERDYFYVGAYYIFSVWIAIGLVGIIDTLRRKIPISATAIAAASVILFLGAIPANLIRVNFESHDRRGDYVAWDYSYNILQTCEPDAILFTNGDNDTFPLWYLQDVEGIRRDVRIVNLSLVNTPWYIQQMKNKPYYTEAKAVPISLSDRQIEAIQPIQFEARAMSLPVSADVYSRFGVTDTAWVNKGRIEFTMRPTLRFGEVSAIRVQDILVQDIIMTNKWERPVYFAVTCSPDSKIGLDEYLWFNGLAWRLEPHKIPSQDAGINPEILETNLFNEPEGFSKTHQYGYKFRGINDPNVYYNENTTRLMINYRSAFIRMALYHGNVTNNPEKALAALDRMEYLVPRSKIPMGWELSSDVAAFYLRLGRAETYEKMISDIEPELLRAIDRGEYNMSSYYNPFRVLLEIYENRREYAKAIDILNRLQAMFPGDPNISQRITALQALQSTQQKTDTLGQSK
ncbi:MAG: DUF2723 domain-containing protein [Bacteroidetes bacterium]|nr:DUF2723 domain-containing protein [Bacteroidota bacterium]MCW5895297.1 DUF2723 domain-containing protein [Bacteroidota bacterium]